MQEREEQPQEEGRELRQGLMQALLQFRRLQLVPSLTGMTQLQVLVLREIALQGGSDLEERAVENRPVRVSEIVSGLQMPSSAISRTLRQLESRGLIERSPDPEDRRVTLVKLTASGRERMQDTVGRVQTCWEHLVEQMGAEKVHQLTDLMNELYELAGAELQACAAQVGTDDAE